MVLIGSDGSDGSDSVSRFITMNKNQKRQKDDLDPEKFLDSFMENHPDIEQLEEEE